MAKMQKKWQKIEKKWQKILSFHFFAVPLHSQFGNEPLKVSRKA